MQLQRSAGIFCHPTSLPSPFGIGDLGSTIHSWTDLLKRLKQQWWQICPVGPVGYGNSPYQTLSTCAGNWLLLSPEQLVADGFLHQTELDSYPAYDLHKVNYTGVAHSKEKLFRLAFSRFKEDEAYNCFYNKEKQWLNDYALFVVLKNMHKGAAWNTWPKKLRLRDPLELKAAAKVERDEMRYVRFLQYLFARQWQTMRKITNDKGVAIMGDIPYYVAFDSCEVWAAPELFEIDSEGKQQRVAGVPPDYFSKSGQLWGNPLYRWDVMKSNGYAWWIARIRRAMELFDAVRIDHFRGFDSYWAVPATHTSARNGKWLKGPGLTFFSTVRRFLGDVPLIAEDLGDITDSVRRLLRQSGIPGMKVLQFAFDFNPDNDYLPYNVDKNSVMYTGTHDNDTTQGWFNALPPDHKSLVCDYCACGIHDFLEKFIRLAYASPSNLVILPFQDVLGYGSEHRFNTPGTGTGNWEWRFTWDMLSEEKVKCIEHVTALFGRDARTTASDKDTNGKE